MKKTFLLLSLALVAFSSCHKESRVSDVTLTATVEQQVDPDATKTYLDGGIVVKWSAGDAVKVFYSGDNAYKFDLKSGVGTTNAVFDYSGSVSGTPQYAIYPYSEGASISGSTITFTLPATQTYAANSFGNGANVAVAQVSGSGMDFKNVCGSFKLQLKGSMKVKTIELTGKAGEKLNGTFSVNVTTAGTTGAAPVGTPAEAEKKLTLDCGEGVQLDSETPTSFYFVVPVSALASGFDAKIIDAAGNTYFTTLLSDKANTINRSKVRVMDSKAVSLLPDGYTELKYIETTGIQYIDTGLKGKNTTSFLVRFANTRILPPSDPGEVVFGTRDGATINCVSLITNAANSTPTPSAACLDFDNYVITRLYTEFGCDLNYRYEAYNSNSYRYVKVSNGLFSEATTSSSKEFVTSENMFIAKKGTYYMANHVNFCGKIFAVRIWENNLPARLYISAVVSDNGGVLDVKGNLVPQGTLGMYDLISNEFFTNDGTGDFIAGPELTD